MARFQVERKHSNIGLFAVLGLAYIALLMLFAWQTWEFVNFLFPQDQLLMKALTLFSFDIMAFLWGCAHLFYRFAHPTAKSAVAWGWGVTNALSLIATVIYMIIQSMFRFQIVVSQGLVNFGYAVTIAALVFNIGILSVFLYNEIMTRFPNEDEFEVVGEPKKTRALSPHSHLAQSVGRSNRDLYDAWRDASIEERQAIMNSYQGHSPRTDVQEMRETSPLAQPPLPTQASQQGSQNGNH